MSPCTKVDILDVLGIPDSCKKKRSKEKKKNKRPTPIAQQFLSYPGGQDTLCAKNILM